MLQGTSVEDCMRLLHDVCDRMGGSIQPQYSLHKDSIRCAHTTPRHRCFCTQFVIFLSKRTAAGLLDSSADPRMLEILITGPRAGLA